MKRMFFYLLSAISMFFGSVIAKAEPIDVIDMRYYKAGTLKEYIDETKPDVVIMPYSSSVFGSKGAFDFGF